MLNVFLEQLSSPNKNLKIELKKGTTSIGRKETDIVLSDSKVSSIHAELHFNGTRVYIYDKNSTNGTYVNSKRIKKTSLKDGDIISLSGLNDKASVIYQLHIVRELEKNKIIFIEKEAKKLKYYLYILLIALALIFFVWLLVPSYQDLTERKIIKSRPWEKLENLPAVPYKLGVQRTLVFNDTVYFPSDFEWLTDIKYEQVEDDSVYEARLNVVEINTAPNENNDQIKAILSIQRFKKDFTRNIDDIISESFIWNESEFKKQNNVSFDFKYSKTPMCLWQWGIWEINSTRNIYAMCISYRGRMILQVSSFDSFLLSKFFQFFVQSYEEGNKD